MDLSLYLVTDSTYHDENTFLNIVDVACKSGVTIIQLREKDKTTREYMDLAIKVKKITDKYNLPLIIDDRVDITLAIDAAGVHLGAMDMPINTARKILGKNKIIGATAKTVEASVLAQKLGADYLGVGAIYPTTTKVTTVITKVSTLNDICDNITIPVVAIGGLNASNTDILDGTKISGIAVVSAIMKSDNVEFDTHNLLEISKSIQLKNN
ncbi:MAG: thiamine-phosphate diphosphorylase [Epulopiscium sp. Nuni2H_MBin003]|nr:MAG: thiamine-phosphate diphosphorylase [Epulopiscium sp. Nuni2H_MBin003]